MPTYEYRCRKCGHVFEVFQNMTDPPRKRCPRCGGRVERLPGTGAGVIFKGSGFYATDYRSPEYRKAQKAESGTDASTAAGKKGEKGSSAAEKGAK